MSEAMLNEDGVAQSTPEHDEETSDGATEQTVAAKDAQPRLRAIVNREALDAALKDIAQAISKKIALPILNNVVLSRDEGALILRATDLEVGIVRRIPVVISTDSLSHASVTLPARKITQFVASLAKGDTVTITQTAQNAVEIAGKRSRARATFIGMPAAEFPIVPSSQTDFEAQAVRAHEAAQQAYEAALAAFPQRMKQWEAEMAKYMEHPKTANYSYSYPPKQPLPPTAPAPLDLSAIKTRTVRLPADHLARAIKQVAYCAATDDARPVFTGVLFTVREGRLVMAAADSFRLGIYSFEVEGIGTNEGWRDLLVPRHTLEILAKLLKSTLANEVSLIIPANGLQAVFAWDNVSLTTNLLVGQFPNYESIVPKGAREVTLSLLRADLEAGVKRAMQFARDMANVVTIGCGRGQVTIGARGEDEGEGTAQEIDASVRYEPTGGAPRKMPETSVFVNGDYLKDFAVNCPTGRLKMEMNGGKNNSAPLVLTPIPNDDERLGYTLTYILMPMHSAR